MKHLIGLLVALAMALSVGGHGVWAQEAVGPTEPIPGPASVTEVEIVSPLVFGGRQVQAEAYRMLHHGLSDMCLEMGRFLLWSAESDTANSGSSMTQPDAEEMLIGLAEIHRQWGVVQRRQDLPPGDLDVYRMCLVPTQTQVLTIENARIRQIASIVDEAARFLAHSDSAALQNGLNPRDVRKIERYLTEVSTTVLELVGDGTLANLGLTLPNYAARTGTIRPSLDLGTVGIGEPSHDRPSIMGDVPDRPSGVAQPGTNAP